MIMDNMSVPVSVGTDVDKLADEAESLLPDMWVSASIHDAVDFVINREFNGTIDQRSVRVYVAVLNEIVRRKRERGQMRLGL